MTLQRDPAPTFEDVEEALSEGDAIFRSRRPGTVWSALTHRVFRRLWIGSFSTNIGTWMRTLVLGAYAYDLTGSSAFIGLLTFAQLGPLLLLGLFGGLVADLFDRRRLLIALQLEQMVAAFALAAVVAFVDDPSAVALFACVLAGGIGNALNLPAWSAVLPELVPREDLNGAISLNSTQVNLSRVIGPAIAGALYPVLGPAWTFFITGTTYVFVIAALLSVRLPPVPRIVGRTWDKLVVGFAWPGPTLWSGVSS